MNDFLESEIQLEKVLENVDADLGSVWPRFSLLFQHVMVCISNEKDPFKRAMLLIQNTFTSHTNDNILFCRL